MLYYMYVYRRPHTTQVACSISNEPATLPPRGCTLPHGVWSCSRLDTVQSGPGTC